MESGRVKITLMSIIVLITLILLIVTGVGYYLLVISQQNVEDTNRVNSNLQGNVVNNNVDLPNNIVDNNVIENNVITNEIVDNNTNVEEVEKYTLTKEEYPKVDGATAMRPMSVEIAKAVLEMTDEEADKFIVHNTTSKAYQNLIDKKADLIFVSEPSDDILNAAKSKNVEFEMVGIGRDGFVFVINKENPVESLTIEQIQNIYTGKITNWKEVGGNDAKILAYQREPNSGSQNLMEKMVMKGLKMTEVPKSLYITNMSGLLDAVASYSNSRDALGYSIYLYAKEQYVKDSIKFLSINNVYPTDETIADGSYPLSKIVYAIYRKDEPQNSNVRKLVEWLKTEEGQKIVEAGGYTALK